MIYLFDQRSLYPHCFIGANLFSKCNKDEEGWEGSIIFPQEISNEEDGIQNKYKKEQGTIEKMIQWMYNQRASIPKSDPRNLAFKIFLNGLYGLTGSPRFSSIYDITIASDCTALARRNIKYARYMFSKEGYECLYTDSDSIFVKDTYNNEEKIKNLAEQISEEQRRGFNIYVPTHGLALECKIKKMWFVRDDGGEFVKKHYLYLKEDNKITIKGLKIIQGNVSPLAKLVFEKYIKPTIQDGTFKPLNKDTVLDLFRLEAKNNPELIVKRYRVWDIETYKKKENGDESTSLHAQISKRYGKGEWWLVCNKHLGPGKGNHYCKVEELQAKYSESWIDHVWIDYYAKDLSEFVDWKQRKQLHKGEPE